MLIKKGCLLSFFLMIFSYVNLVSQERSGFYQSNYAGISSIALNPAKASAHYPLKWDLNLVSAGLFLQTNYAYLENASLFSAISNTSDLVESTPENNSQNNSTASFFDYDDGTSKKFVSENITLNGPSFLLKLNENTFGIFTNVRNYLGVNRVEPAFNYATYRNTADNENIAINPFKMGFINWSEIGLHYGRNINSNLSVGANLKYLNVYDAMFVNSKSATNMAKDEDDLLFENIDIDFGTAGNFDSDSENDYGYSLSKNGSGIALDLGVNYILESNNNAPYQLSLGASLIDFGFANLKSKAGQYGITTDIPFEIRTNELKDIEDHEEVIDIIQAQTSEGDLSVGNYSTFEDNKFKIWLPVGIALQADYAFTENLFLSANLVRRVRLKGAMAERSNSFNISPRYESRWIDVMMPLTLVNDSKFNWGLAVRLAFITIGTDNFQSLIGKKEFNGTDFYASIKINPFTLGANKGSKSNKAKSRSNVSCPKF